VGFSLLLLLYLEIAYERWKREGKLVNLSALREAIYLGAVQRVRPKAMTRLPSEAKTPSMPAGVPPVQFGPAIM